MSARDPFEELIDNAPSMDIDILVARLRELGNSASELMENAFYVAEVLSPERRELLVAALGLSHEQQAKLKSMLGRAPDTRQSPGALPNESQRLQTGHHLRFARGTLIDERYEIRGLLGRGGMGAVYEAHDAKLGRRVAIKFLLAQAGGELASRFVREARTTAKCKHENIVEIHDVGEHKGSPDAPSGCPFMVLEYLEGETLRRRLVGVARTEQAPTPGRERTAAKQPPPALTACEALDIIIPVVRALVCAHRHDIVHRDLKPENIFITRADTIKVLDFGIAKAPIQISSELADTPSAALWRDDVRTRDGVWLGTTSYMSPEQWGMGEVDQRSDLWAVGVVLYEMLTGEHPLPAASITELRTEVCDLDRPMPRLRDAMGGTGALADVIDRCLRKKTSERMASASELLAALEQIRASLSAPAEKSIWLRRAALGLTSLACLTVGLVTVTRMACQEQPRLDIPRPPDHTRGVVVAVAKDASEGARGIYDSLCQKIGGRLPRATICVELADARLDDKALEHAAAPAATLVVRVDSEYAVRFLPITESISKDDASIASELPALGPIWTSIPSVNASSAGIQEQVAALAIVFSRVLAGEVSTERFDIPPARVDDVDWRFAALTWGLGLIYGNENKLVPADVAVARQECARQPQPLADWYCAAVHYAYAAGCKTCGDIESVLERLAREGTAPFQDMAKVRLSRVYCERGELAAAAQRLVEVDNAWNEIDCRRLALTGPAMCLLSRGNASLDEPTLEPLKRLASLQGLESCDAPGRALAISERAWWHYQYQQWLQAEQDWHQAWQLDPRRKDYLLNWAEALLRQRRDRTDVASLIGQQLKPESMEGSQQSRAAFLRWVATRHRDDANALYALYEQAKEGEQVLRSGEVERGLCEEPGNDAVCRIYDILTMSKRAADRDQLRELLFTAGGE